MPVTFGPSSIGIDYGPYYLAGSLVLLGMLVVVIMAFSPNNSARKPTLYAGFLVLLVSVLMFGYAALHVRSQLSARVTEVATAHIGKIVKRYGHPALLRAEIAKQRRQGVPLSQRQLLSALHHYADDINRLREDASNAKRQKNIQLGKETLD